MWRLFLLGGNLDLFHDLLGQFQNDYKDFGAEMQEDFETGNLDNVRKKAHLLKGVSINLGMEALHAASMRLESFAQGNDADKQKQALAHFHFELGDILRALAENKQEAPAKESDETAKEKPVEPAEEPEETAHSEDTPRSILVAEDSKINQMVLVKLLTSLGYDVTAADDGAAGLALADEHSFDVILTDLDMPNMDGYEMSQAIVGGDGPNKATPIVAVTGTVNDEVAAACKNAGMVDCVPKVMKKEEMEAFLKGILDN